MQLIIAIIIAIIIYVIQKSLYRRLWDRNLNVEILFDDDYIENGQKSVVNEIINNAKFLPLPVFHVKFSAPKSFKFNEFENAVITDRYYRNDAFSVMGNQKVTRKLEFVAEKRGLYGIDDVRVISRDFFMTGSFAKSIENNAKLYVFPRKIYDMKLEIMFNTMLGEIETRNAMLEDPYTFRGIRDYDSSDNMGKINWKATARTGSLKVNLYNHTSEQKVKLILNMDTNYMVRSEYIQEIGIELVSSAAQYFLGHRISVMSESNGLDVITGECGRVESGSSLNHMITIDRYLSRIKDNGGMERFFDIINREISEINTGVSYIIVSSYCREDLLIKLDYMKSQGIDINMIVPYYDRYGLECTRDYMHGWEVKLIET